MPGELSPHQQALLEEELSRIRAVRARDTEVLRQHQGELGGVVDQIRVLRAEIDERVGKLAMACQQLQQSVRRNPSELTQGYLVFAGSHVRLAGALQQALRRTTPMDRVLERTHQEAENERVRQAHEQERRDLRVAEGRVRRIMTATDDDLDDLFGLEEDDLG